MKFNFQVTKNPHIAIHKYTHLLFDADNTIFDFNSSSKMAIASVLENLGIQLPKNYYEIYRQINLKVWEAYERGEIEPLQLRTSRFEQLGDYYDIVVDPIQMSQSYLEQLVVHYKFLPRAKEILHELNGHFQLVYITNGLADVQRPRLQLSEIDHLFESIIIADEIGHQKPNASYFDYTLNSIQNPAKEHILVIGDNLTTDIQGGRDYGLDTCWLNRDRKRNRTEIIPTFEIQHLEELTTILL